MELTIRAATMQDYDGLCAVLAEADRLHMEQVPQLFQSGAALTRTRELIQALIDSPKVGLFIAEVQGELVGAIHLSVRDTPDDPLFVPGRMAHVNELAVKETFRRQGVGRALMEQAEHWAVAQGARAIDLNVYAFNRGAQTLYEGLGYWTLSRRMYKTLE